MQGPVLAVVDMSVCLSVRLSVTRWYYYVISLLKTSLFYFGNIFVNLKNHTRRLLIIRFVLVDVGNKLKLKPNAVKQMTHRCNSVPRLSVLARLCQCEIRINWSRPITTSQDNIVNIGCNCVIVLFYLLARV